MPQCKVGLATGGLLQEVTFEAGADVGRVLYLARVQVRPGDQILIRGKPVEENHPVIDKDIILVSPPVAGG